MMTRMSPGHVTKFDAPAIQGVYAITPDCANTEDLLGRVRQALFGGINILQYRNKAADAVLRLEQARALCELAHEFAVPFIVNDDVQLAIKVAADGVHLGEADGGVTEARAILGKDKLIGVSCYNRLPLAIAAVTAGADYVAFGAFYPSSTKPNTVIAAPELLQKARSNLAVPIVVIGGITANNGAPLIEAGANAIAVIAALFDAPDIRLAAQNFSHLFAPHHSPIYRTPPTALGT